MSVSKNILLIDDDDDLREIIHFALVERGHNVRSFEGPFLALSILTHGDFVPDLIIVDQYMKDMTGGEFLEIKNQLGERRIRNCPSLIISGSPQDVEKNVPRTRYTEILPKPLDMEGLLARVEELFSGEPERAPEKY